MSAPPLAAPAGAAELELESFQGTIRLVEREAAGMSTAREKVKHDKAEKEKEKEMERQRESGEN